MTSKFEAEKAKVVLLMQRLGRTIEVYEDPNYARGAAGESGADVIAISSGRRIGIQVTDLDTGARLGKARAEEMKLARAAQAQASTYFVWGQNDPSELVEAIARSVARKSQMSFSGFDEFWLLICTGVPTSGAVGSTFAMTPWIQLSTLDAATLPDLESSKYSQAFIHCILGVEDQALFQWCLGGSWSKFVRLAQAQEQRHPLWEAIRNPDSELLRDPGDWFQQTMERAVREAKKSGS